MKLTLQQCMLLIAVAVAFVMTWIASVDRHFMAVVFLAEAVLGVWILAGTVRQQQKKDLPECRTEEEY